METGDNWWELAKRIVNGTPEPAPVDDQCPAICPAGYTRSFRVRCERPAGHGGTHWNGLLWWRDER